MKIKLNSYAFFKAVFLIATITFLVGGLIFFTQNVENSGFFDDFDENKYINTQNSTTTQANEIYINSQWYSEKTEINTWVFLGLDKSKEELENETDNSTTQADFIFVVVFDEENETYQTLQINRDTMVDIDVLSMNSGSIIGSTFGQITLANAYGYTIDQGAQNVVRAVSRLLYDTSIDYYISFSLDIISIINDAVGGVEIEVLHDFSVQYPEMTVGATVTLTSEQAQAYVQQRYGVEDQTNIQRMQRQIQYLEALQEAVYAKQYDTEFSMNLLLTVCDYIYTDATFTKLQSFMEKYSEYEHIAHHSIEGETVQGEVFIEFYADDDQLIDLVLDLFYIPIEK